MLPTDTINRNPLHCISLPGYSFDCFLKLSQVELDTKQEEQMLKDLIGAMRAGICGAMRSRKKTKANTEWYEKLILINYRLCINAKFTI